MLNDIKKDLTVSARRLPKPYEKYTIDELADAYCDAVDNNKKLEKDIYISALILRFWFTIDKMYKSNTVVPSLEYEDFYCWLYEAIEYACKYRGWKDPNKHLNAQQCINKCINTIKLQKYYDLRLDKRKIINHTVSLSAPVGGESETDADKTIGDTLEAEQSIEDYTSAEGAISLIQSYINNNKLIEAVLLDNIAFNDVQRHFKKVIKTKNAEGKDFKYTEYSSEFWPYQLVKIVSKLPASYKRYFQSRYRISEDKLNACLDVIHKANTQKLYKYLRNTLSELKTTYAA